MVKQKLKQKKTLSIEVIPKLETEFPQLGTIEWDLNGIGIKVYDAK
jgi:hypothetical protein